MKLNIRAYNNLKKRLPPRLKNIRSRYSIKCGSFNQSINQPLQQAEQQNIFGIPFGSLSISLIYHPLVALLCLKIMAEDKMQLEDVPEEEDGLNGQPVRFRENFRKRESPNTSVLEKRNQIPWAAKDGDGLSGHPKFFSQIRKRKLESQVYSHRSMKSTSWKICSSFYVP